MPPSNLPIRSPKIRHSSENPIRTGRMEDGLAVTRLIVAAADKSPDRHAGRLAGLDAADTVLDYQGAARIRAHLFRRIEEQVGRGLTAFDHLRRIEPLVEVRRQTGEVKREGY